ncbi:MAG: YybH family protein [Candidatus Rifleibacteriota bacterium]
MPNFLTKNSSLVLLSGFVCLVLLITGCGGGGGDSAISTSPEELEVRESLAALAANIRSKDLSATMNGFYSNLKYYPVDTQVFDGYEDYIFFKNRLDNFFTKAVLTEFTIETLGVSIGIGGDIAQSRASLRCKYTDNEGEDHLIEERIEMLLEKDSEWGITEIYAYDSSAGQTGMRFPPEI